MTTRDKHIEKESADIDKMIAEDMAERKTALYRHKLPAELDLKAMLMAMTKAELDDIRYNLKVEGASSLKKAELAKRLVPEIVNFAKKWLPTALEDEYDLFSHLLQNGGSSAKLAEDDVRFDYLRGIGLISCAQKDDALVWYMPKEIQTEFKKIDSGMYKSLAMLNSTVARLANGCLFYYGFMNYEELYHKVCEYLEQEEKEQVSFGDFFGVILNAACWQNILIPTTVGVKYYTLLDEFVLEKEQVKRSDLDFAKLSYSDVYDAGSENYIEATPAYKELAQFFMRESGLEVLQAADVVGEIIILLQNGETISAAVNYVNDMGLLKEAEQYKTLMYLLSNLNNTTRLWFIKGHTPNELAKQAENFGKIVPFADVRRQKVGRNDPCPCGSGKKYKNCCLHKDEN